MVESKTKTLAVGGGWLIGPPRAHASRRVDDPAGPGPGYGPTLPSPGSLIDGKYRIERVIARGGAGIVYAASHCVSGKKVALKWLSPGTGPLPGARERFFREASATARIAHPNIVDIYDVCADQGSAYLVMEYLHGETLAARLTRGPVVATQAIAWLMPVLRAVDAAHAHGVIHRDLKPENIFLCCTEAGETREPKVLDFGISKITSDEERDLGLTRNDTILGTPYYMSPEQIRGARTVDERTDVYALGVMLFEVLTGRKPFEADTYNELIVKIMTEPPPGLAELAPQLDPALVAVVEKAMAHDADARIGSALQLAEALAPFGDGTSFRKPHASQSVSIEPTVLSAVAAVGEQATPPSRATSRRRIWLPLAAAGALLLGFELITHLSGLAHEVRTDFPAGVRSSQLPSARSMAPQPSHTPVQLTSEVPRPPLAPAPTTPIASSEGLSSEPGTSPGSTSDISTAAADKPERQSNARRLRHRRQKRAAALQTRSRLARPPSAPALPGVSLDSRDFR
jgi:serine/threonine-protein kinase